MKRSTGLILLVVSGLFFIAAGVIMILTYNRVKKRQQNVLTSPYFTRWACGTDEYDDVTNLDPEDDPLRIGYLNVNYCYANAPRCQIIEKIAKEYKALSNGDITDKKFKEFLDPEGDLRPLVDFYVDYVDRCGYGIGDGVSADVGNEIPASPDDPNPNDPDFKYGPNDEFFALLISICNNQLGKDDESCKALSAKYPSQS